MNGNHRSAARRAADRSIQSRLCGCVNSRRAVSAFCLASSLMCAATYGQDNWNNSAGGSWAVGTNWSTGSAPTSTTAVFNLNSSSGYTVTIPVNETISSNMDVETDNATFSLGGNTLFATGGLDVGDASGQVGSATLLGPGTFNDTGLSAVLSVGGNGGTGQLTVNGQRHVRVGPSHITQRPEPDGQERRRG